MANPSADQVQMANEVLAGTRQITGTSEAPTENASNQEEARRQAMDIATPEFQAQVNAVETSGFSASNVAPSQPDIGMGDRSIDKLPDAYDTKAVEAFRDEKRVEVSGPGE